MSRDAINRVCTMLVGINYQPTTINQQPTTNNQQSLFNQKLL
jgi:hypothetical protein